MRKEIDKIEIKDPPIEELNKKKSCLRRSCFNGCGCLMVIFLISLVLLKVSLGPKTKELKDLPKIFSENIPLYDIDDVERIAFTSGKERSQFIETVAYIPKAIIAPAVLYSKKVRDFLNIEITDSTSTPKTKWQHFFEFVGKPITRQRDKIEIEWIMLPAKKDFIIEYYKKELKKNNFQIGLESQGKNTDQFTFVKNDFQGVIYILDKPETKETDLVSMTVQFNLDETL